MAQDYRTWRARLDGIHDGDTIRLVVDCGFDSTHREWVRLRGVYAPELKQEGGSDARIFVQSWLSSHIRETVRWPLEVDTYRTAGDENVVTLGRYVAEVRCAEDGASLNVAVNAMLAANPQWGKGTGA